MLFVILISSLLMIDLCPNMWSNLENVHVYLIKCLCYCFGGGERSSVLSDKPIITCFHMFCVVVLAIIISRVVKSHNVIVFLLIVSITISNCFIYLGAPEFVEYIFLYIYNIF